MTTGLEGLLIGSTIAGFKCGNGQELNWLQHAEAWKERGAEFACALQVGQGKDDALHPLSFELEALEATEWTFSVNQKEDFVTSDNRLINICTGRNLIQEIAMRDPSITALLFLDTDILCPEDLPERLLEVHHPMVGANCPQYCLDGPRLDVENISHFLDPSSLWSLCRSGESDTYTESLVQPFPEGADVREHWNTAGCLLVHRPVFREIAWSWDPHPADPQHAVTDDPHYQYRAAKQFGMTWCRHDVTVLHEPLRPLEQRNHDRRVIRP